MEPSAILGLKQKSWRHLGAEPNLWPWPSQFSRPRGRAARPRASSGTPSAVRGTWKTTANGSTNSGGTPMVNVRNSEHSIHLLTSTYYGFSQTYSPMRGAWPPPAAPALRTSAHQKPLRPTGRSRLSTQKKTRGVAQQTRQWIPKKRRRVDLGSLWFPKDAKILNGPWDPLSGIPGSVLWGLPCEHEHLPAPPIMSSQ